MSKDRNNKKGFTLAEIIISMTIIGVIAAMTIPALLVSTSDKALDAQKKAFFARVSQAMSQIEDLRVYAKTDDSGNDKSSALNFITKSLNKVYRITGTCSADNITINCSFPSEITTQNGTTFSIASNKKLSTFLGISASDLTMDTEVAGFTTANGESIAIYYNPNCRGEKTNGFYGGSATTAMCLNLVYDLNGVDGAPNEMGKDVGFLTVFFPKDPDIASPMPFAKDATLSSSSNYQDVIDTCKKQNKTTILPNWLEGMAIAVNKKLTNVNNATYIVSGAGTSQGAYTVDMDTFTSIAPASSDWGSGYSLRCVYNK